MVKKKVDWKIVVAVIIAITIIETVALLKGINGTMLLITVGTLSTIAGIAIPKEIIKS